MEVTASILLPCVDNSKWEEWVWRKVEESMKSQPVQCVCVSEWKREKIEKEEGWGMDWASHRAGSEDTKRETVVVVEKWQCIGHWKSTHHSLLKAKSHANTHENEKRFGEGIKSPFTINRHRHPMSLHHSLSPHPLSSCSLPACLALS